jgi:hypothetical protein
MWDQRRNEAEASTAQVAEQIVAADAHTTELGAQVQAQSERLPQIEETWRAAQAAANAQRLRVTNVQQQIQVLASEGRGIADQQRQLTARRDRLSGEMSQLAAPDAERLAQSRQHLADADAASAGAEALLAQLGAQVPALDDARRACQIEVNTEAGRQSGLTARLAALKSLQDKVQTEGKLRPWLAKQGLDFGQPAGIEPQRFERLGGFGRLRCQFAPEGRRLGGLAKRPGRKRGLGCAASQARVARLAGERHVGIPGGAEFAALYRDVGRKDLKEDLGGEPDRGQAACSIGRAGLRRCSGGFGRGGPGVGRGTRCGVAR